MVAGEGEGSRKVRMLCSLTLAIVGVVGGGATVFSLEFENVKHKCLTIEMLG